MYLDKSLCGCYQKKQKIGCYQKKQIIHPWKSRSDIKRIKRFIKEKYGYEC